MNDPTLKNNKLREKKPKFWIYWAIIAAFTMIAFVVYDNVSVLRVEGSSMEPTYKDGDLAFIVKEDGIKNNQIIVFKASVIWTEIAPQENGKELVRRVGAAPKTVLSFDGRSFASNGHIFATLPKDYPCPQSSFERVLRKNEIFVIGDNEREALDSKSIFCRGSEGWLITDDLVKTTGHSVLN